MKPLIVSFLLVLTCCLTAFDSYAWDIEIGYRRLVPRIGVGEQEYEDEAGNKQNIKPIAETMAIGQSYHFGVRIEEYSADLDFSEFEYDSAIEADNEAVSTDTEITAKTVESRIGINYHIERELAGMFAGIGVSFIRETLESDGNSWAFESRSPYIKIGADLIFNSFRARYEQIYLSMGEHSLQINSIGLLMLF